MKSVNESIMFETSHITTDFNASRMISTCIVKICKTQFAWIGLMCGSDPHIKFRKPGTPSSDFPPCR